MIHASAALAVLLLAAAPAAEPPYPASDSAETVVEWVGAHTDLPKADIVLIGAGGVFALSADPAQPATTDGRLLRRLREEITDPALAGKLGGRSFSGLLTIDCAHFNSSLTEAMVYPGVSLRGGPGKPIKASQWLSASSIYLYDLTGPICEKSPRAAPAEAAPPAPAPTAAPTPSPAAETPSPPPAEASPPPSEPSAAPVAAEPPAVVARPVKAKPKAEPAAASGEVWLQAGAYASEAAARDRFEALAHAVAPTPLLGPRLEPVPDQPLVRLLIGPFPSRAWAARTCAALKRQKADCFVRP
jgi:hypothetical protein